MSPLSEENQSRKEKIANSAGVNTNQVRAFAYELGILRNRGMLVALNIKGTSLFERKAEFSEYGIGAESILRNRLKTGKKRILPVDASVKVFASIAATLRQTLKKYSYALPGFAPYKFVTFDAFEGRFKTKFVECLELWNAEIENLITNLDAYRDQIALQAAAEAEKSWEHLGEFKIGDKVFDFEEYVDHCVARDLADIPTESRIRDTMKLDYLVAMVYGDTDIAKDQAEAQDIRLRMEMSKESQSLENQMMAEQLRTDRSRNQIAEEEMRQRREAVLAEEVAHVRQQLAESGSPFDQIVREARNRAADSAAEMLLSIKKNGFVKGKVAEKGKGLLEFFQIMATHDDRYLMDMLEKLNTQIGTVSDRKDAPERDADAIAKTLQNIIGLADVEFKTILSDKGTFSAIELD